jgi:predicted DNA-binding protein YlxM (UPF0122 family)
LLSRMVWMGLLCDYYGVLLTDKQRRVVELHHHSDLSLGEIAQLEGISRQAVHDVLRRAETSLAGYEAKLGLCRSEREARERGVRVREALATARSHLDGSGPGSDHAVRLIDEAITLLAEEGGAADVLSEPGRKA